MMLCNGNRNNDSDSNNYKWTYMQNNRIYLGKNKNNSKKKEKRKIPYVLFFSVCRDMEQWQTIHLVSDDSWRMADVWF